MLIIPAEGLDNPCIFCVQIVKIASSNNGERQNKGGRNMKRKMLSVLLCAAMMGTTLAGATSVLAADDKIQTANGSTRRLLLHS